MGAVVKTRLWWIVAGAALGGFAPPVQEAAWQLESEAGRIKAGVAPMPANPDFASRASAELAPADVVAMLARRASRDPFVDAYVRWQMTSYGPALGPLDGKTFAALVRSPPRLLDNPRADPQVIALFEEVKAMGPLGESGLKRMRDLVARLEEQTAQVQTMNVPAAGVFDWCHDRFGTTGLRPRLWLLVRCATEINAGWPVAEIKSRITRSFGEAKADTTLTAAHRDLLARQAQALVGLERRSVNEVTFMADGSVRVTFSTSRVSQADIDRWVKKLQ